jgi:8-oxo-dGTP diphosphatase
MNKGGCVLISKDWKKVGLVYRKKRNDYSFPKGNIEEGESISMCALRETEEETGRKCKLLMEEPLEIISYTDSEGEIKNYMFLAVDDGYSKKGFKEEDKEEFVWVDFDKVEELLTYQNLKVFWNRVKSSIENIARKSNISE